MANQKIFCAVPWHNTHLYWDGTYGACCFEKNLITHNNIKNQSLQSWFNSQDMKQFRQRILGNEPVSECEYCYAEEKLGHESKRIKENYKVGIFTEQAFDASFKQSPWFSVFEHAITNGDTNQLPRDWHIDLGNECNLACKMCFPRASSKIYKQYKKWNIANELKPNWTTDTNSWQQFLKNIELVPKLHRLHIMGGEPTINKKFYELLDWLIDNNKTSMSLSFVTNGTNLNANLIKKLKKFDSCDIEVSIESFNPESNDYIRQGSNTKKIIQNLKKLIKQQSLNFNLVLRSTPQLLSINSYHQYIRFAFDNQISIQSIPLFNPEYFAIGILPWEIKKVLIENIKEVQSFIIKNNKINFSTISTGRDISRLDNQLIRECETIINLLTKPVENVEEKRHQLIEWLIKWDEVYKYDARIIYPEYKTFLESYGYRI